MADDPADKEVKERIEENRFRILKQAHDEGVIQVLVDYRLHNTSRSPVFSLWENIAPLLSLVLLSMAILVLKGVAFGTLALVLATLFYAFVLKPWVAHRVEERVVAALMDNLHDFKLLWGIGGIALSLTDSPGVGCAAPSGDWRNFARNSVPVQEEKERLPVEENPLSPTRGEKSAP
ncbi:MAG: hypothetical protein ABT940_04255 [Alphaproteobacteria bacterium]